MFSYFSELKALAKPAPVFFRRSAIAVVLISSVLSGFHGSAQAGRRNADYASSSPTNPQVNPDQLLIETFQALSANQLNLAEQKIDALLAAYPNYQLAHLIRGDLLLMHTRKVSGLRNVACSSGQAERNARRGCCTPESPSVPSRPGSGTKSSHPVKKTIKSKSL
jgi:hypothetical protein